ncbi:MAG: alkaline phosphatase PhoX [Phycisphaerales bacterium]
MQRTRRYGYALGTLSAAMLTWSAIGAQGSSSSQTPYVEPTAPGIGVTSILTVGDAADNGYQMVGVPDGLGAFDNGNGTFTVLMNHELGNTQGIVRAHGSAGAFVSQWVINKADFNVVSGQDMIQSAGNVNLWNGAGWTAATTAWNRLCSADLADVGAFYNAASGKGYAGRIFMNGEENGPPFGDPGRAFGWIATGSDAGKAYELPYLGKFAWENSLANPFTGDKTVVIGTDDTTPGEVYLYVGDKQTTGNAVEMAGLHGGSLYGVKVPGVPTETSAINGSFSLEPVTGNTSGADLQTESTTDGVTQFARPEDGHWLDADTFFFVTTGASGQSAKLYRMDFSDANDLTLGGSITMVQDSAALLGTDGQAARSFDNLVVAADGTLLIQEDPGNTSYDAKTWLYNPVTDEWTQILESDRDRFITGGISFLTQDEENSGIIEITDILARNDGLRYFLADTQAHYNIAGELVQGGQLYVVSIPEPATVGLLTLGGLALSFRGRRRNVR